MKRLLAVLVLLLLLAGCTPDTPEQTSAPTTEATQTTEPTQPIAEDPGLYAPDSLAERLTDGAVRTYPLGDNLSIGIMSMGENLLVISVDTQGTRLTVLSGENCTVTTQRTITDSLIAEEGTMRVTSEQILYYDDSSSDVVVLNKNLQETHRVSLPEGIVGSPVIGEDLRSVYYCTENKIHALDMETGISRLLRQHECQWQTLEGVYFSDSVLGCYITEHDGRVFTCFLSTTAGELIGMDETLWELDTYRDSFYLRRGEGYLDEYLYGTKDAEPMAFLPKVEDTVFSVLSMNGVLGVTGLEYGCSVAFYDLETGKKTAAEELPLVYGVYSVVGDPERNCLWLMSYDVNHETDVLYRWDLAESGVSEETVYTDVRYTSEKPDTEGLAQLRAWAESLGAQHGIEIVLGTDVLEPDDYTLDYEYRVEAFQYGMEQLEKALSVYPEGFLSKAVENTAAGVLQVGLVRDISDDSVGVQYWLDGDAYIALEIGSQMEQTVYHEVSHVLDSYIIANSYAYDDWEELSPKGFQYDYNYEDHKIRMESPYLEGEDRAFIDSYSMSYPKEDRARILEYAIMPGNAELFASDTMQKKLLQICQGIRESFEYERYEGTFLWEQYLEESLAYVKKKK